MRLRMYLTIGYPGADHEEEIEVDDDATEDDLHEITQDWANGYIEWGHEVIEEGS